MKGIVFTGLKEVQLKEMPIPESSEGWARIKVAYAGICGSDYTIFLGAHPRATAPLVLGHEFSGYLDEDIPGMAKGTLVTVNPLLYCGHCSSCISGNSHVCKYLELLGIDQDGGMAEYVVAPIDRIFQAPEGVSPKVAAFIEPIAVAVHAIRTTQYLPGDDALVFGAGAIGLATAITLRQFGASNVTICEPNPVRLRLAQELGFDCVLSSENTAEQLLDNTSGDGFDLVFDCAGHQSVADILPDVVKIRGEICIVAGYKYPPTMNFQKGMFKEFSIQFVRVYQQKDFQVACELVANQPQYGQLVNYEVSPEDCEYGFELYSNPKDAVKILFRFAEDI